MFFRKSFLFKTCIINSVNKIRINTSKALISSLQYDKLICFAQWSVSNSTIPLTSKY